MAGLPVALELGRSAVQNVDLTFQRDVLAQLRPDDRLQVIKGPRGVGKTTALQQFAKLNYAPEKTAYLSLDDPALAGVVLVDVIHQLQAEGVRHFLLDEVHRYANWSRHLKSAYDRYPAITVLATGSSISGLTEGDADLSRRSRKLLLQGLTWREHVRFEGAASLPQYTLAEIAEHTREINSTVKAAIESPVQSYRRYLEVGYYPFYETDPAGYHGRIKATAITAIDVDIQAGADISNETILKTKKLLNLIASSVPFTPNMSTLAQQLGTTRNQVYKLLDLLDRAMLIRRLWSDGRSPKLLAKPERIYLENTNLAYALSQPDVGNLRETAVLNALQPNYPVGAHRLVDFQVDKQLFEVGGPNKTSKQTQGLANCYRVLDGVDLAVPGVIPIYLFGLLD